MPSLKSVGTAITILLCLVMAVVAMSHLEASGTWSPTGSMSTPRAGHTATLLPDGRVLVSGGGSAEIYNPALATWSPTGSTMSPSPANWRTATLLLDGRVLFSGAGSAEIYNPALGTWSATGSMRASRLYHTATLLQDGRVLVTGGQYDFFSIDTSASAEIYDPALGTWSLTGSMTAERQAHSATLLLDGRVLVSGGYASYLLGPESAGGYTHGYSYWDSAEIYDPVSGTWWETGSMRSLRFSHMSTLLSDGRVLATGGYYAYSYPWNPHLASAEIYNPARGIWSPTAVMSTPRVGHTATLLPDGRVLVSGGLAVDTALASAEIYSPGPPDATPPALSCAAADGAWHNNDVTIACTASDLESGLANAADASFNLTTTVPAGTETANAVTNSRQVCDMAGNCSTAGPFNGNKVDKKAPTIAIASPTAGATYGPNAKVAASYGCSDGGSGMTSCTGPVANGSLVNTSSKGTKTFAVTAVDTVGNSATVSVTYSVVAGRR